MKSSNARLISTLLVAFLLTLGAALAQSPENKRAKSDIVAICVALNGFKKYSSIYPSTAEGLLILVKKPKDYQYKWAQCMTDVPMDPWNRPYQYRSPGTHNPTSYDVFSFGADGKESSDDIGNWTDKTEQDAAANP